jgi:hypothetical protein
MNVQLSGAIRRFQVVYVRDDLMRIRIVKNAAYTTATEQQLRGHLAKNFPRDMEFEFSYVPEIRPQISGKYQMVVNEINNGRARE